MFLAKAYYLLAVTVPVVSDGLAKSAMENQFYGYAVLIIILFSGIISVPLVVMVRSLNLLKDVQKDAQRPWSELALSHDKTLEALMKNTEALACLKERLDALRKETINIREDAKGALNENRSFHVERARQYDSLLKNMEKIVTALKELWGGEIGR